jgi:hypothetical protein
MNILHLLRKKLFFEKSTKKSPPPIVLKNAHFCEFFDLGMCTGDPGGKQTT